MPRTCLGWQNWVKMGSKGWQWIAVFGIHFICLDIALL
jgi:hypothetical protein